MNILRQQTPASPKKNWIRIQSINDKQKKAKEKQRVKPSLFSLLIKKSRDNKFTRISIRSPTALYNVQLVRRRKKSTNKNLLGELLFN